jgi:hypothetical protein
LLRDIRAALATSAAGPEGQDATDRPRARPCWKAPDRSLNAPGRGVERGINGLRRKRAVATRFDKLAVRYKAAVHIAAINE